MKRREEIEKAAHQKYPYEGGTKGAICEFSIPIFIQSAEWADKTMIEKACKWLSNNKDNYIIDIEGETLINDQIITDFRKAMEE